jgi:hypothetical protein
VHFAVQLFGHGNGVTICIINAVRQPELSPPPKYAVHAKVVALDLRSAVGCQTSIVVHRGVLVHAETYENIRAGNSPLSRCRIPVGVNVPRRPGVGTSAVLHVKAQRLSAGVIAIFVVFGASRAEHIRPQVVDVASFGNIRPAAAQTILKKSSDSRKQRRISAEVYYPWHKEPLFFQRTALT